MTDRVKGFTVTLENDMREDDFERIQDAVSLIKGVLHVEPKLVTIHDHSMRCRVKSEITLALLDEINKM